MTAVTPNYDFVYPIAADRPQDATLAWAQMVTQLEGALTFLDKEFQRFIRLPLVILEATKAQTLTFGDEIAFDAVVEDTYGMTDLAVSPYSITIPASVPGTYMVGAQAVMGGQAANDANAVAGLNLLTPWGYINSVKVPQAVSADTGIGVQAWTIERVSASADALTRSFEVSVMSTSTVTYARFWAFWLSDY